MLKVLPQPLLPSHTSSCLLSENNVYACQELYVRAPLKQIPVQIHLCHMAGNCLNEDQKGIFMLPAAAKYFITLLRAFSHCLNCRWGDGEVLQILALAIAYFDASYSAVEHRRDQHWNETSTRTDNCIKPVSVLRLVYFCWWTTLFFSPTCKPRADASHVASESDAVEIHTDRC